MKRALVPVSLLASVLVACVGTTGGDVIDFPAAAAGPEGAAGPMELTTDLGWHVVLTKAKLHVGALYLSQTQPVSGAQVTSCVLPGTYVAEVLTGADFDLLSGQLQKFPAPGHGTTLEALVGQVWLVGGDVDTVTDATPILVVEGTADRAGVTMPFSGTLTISGNRAPAAGDTAGASTICKQRIVSPIRAHVPISHTGGIVLRVDPRVLFTNVDFARLDPAPNGGFAFSDDPTDVDPTSPTFYSQPSVNLYDNLRSAGTLYTFTWDDTLR